MNRTYQSGDRGRRWRRLALLAVFLCIATGFGSVAVRATSSDADNDGIDDDVENTLAERFLPAISWDFDEYCPGPTPRTILFRARHPTIGGSPATNFILINYVQLYDEDCGFWFPHDGDNEAFLVFLKWDGSDWQFQSISATAHWGESGWFCGDTASASYDDMVWIGEAKHGTYADTSLCGCWGGDTCDDTGLTLGHALYNAGEPYSPLISYFDEIENYWLNRGVWDNSQFQDAGHVTEQLILNFDHFAIATWPDQPPPDEDCLSACDAAHHACIVGGQESLDQCDQEYASCQDGCSNWVNWDSGS